MLSSEFLLDLASSIRSSLEYFGENLASEITAGQKSSDKDPAKSTSLSAPQILTKKAYEQKHFVDTLFGFIDRGPVGLNDFCSRIGADVQKFSSLRTSIDKSFKPSREVVILFCMALELSLEDTQKLLAAICRPFDNLEIYDLVIMFCIKHKVYDIDDVNAALQCFNLKSIPEYRQA